MRDLIKYAALALGGYLVYRQIAPTAAADSSTSGSTGSNNTGSSNTGSSNTGSSNTGSSNTGSSNTGENNKPPADPAVNLEALMRAVAGRPRPTDLLTFDQWNYMYAQVRGTAGPAIEDAFPGTERSYLMTYAEWKAGVAPFGI